MQKLFLDTNLILDLLGERQPYYEAIACILTLADRKQIQVITSPLAIATTHYILMKFEKSQSALEKIRRFKILCGISNMDEQIVDKALNANFNDFEDALQYFSAVDSNCDILLTRNEKDFKQSLIPVMNPTDYLHSYLGIK